MSDEGGAGRRRGLFRRNRDADDLGERSLDQALAELPPPDEDEVAIWEQTASAASRVPKRTADMFAPKESFSDTWSEDAWDDEWKEPAVRRTSIPPAADPTPRKVDEWLESGADGFEDMTRDAVRKLGVDPALAAARAVRPGSTWDDTGDVASKEAAARDAADPALQATIERALTNPVSGTATPEAPVSSGVSKRFGRARAMATEQADATTADAITADQTEAHAPDTATPITATPVTTTGDSTTTDSTETDHPHEAVIDVTEPVAPHVNDRLDTAARQSTAPDPSAQPAPAPAPTSEALDSPASSLTDELDELPAREWDRPVFNPSAGASDGESADSTALDPTGALESDHNIADTHVAETHVADTRGTETVIIDDEPDTAVELIGPGDQDSVGAHVASTDDEVVAAPRRARVTPNEDDEEIEMDRTRAHAFTDRASWVGTGLAGVAVARLAFHVASNMKQAEPGDQSISALTRIGGGFANAGVLHGLLLIAAVTLLSLPALFDRDELVPRRTGTGLGLTLGAAVVGLIGMLVALLTQSSLADALGTRVTLGGTGDVLAALALSVVALGAAMRALRSFD